MRLLRHHVRKLRDYGWSVRAIARLYGTTDAEISQALAPRIIVHDELRRAARQLLAEGAPRDVVEANFGERACR